MQVYRLTPTPEHIEDRSWRSSSHKGEIIVCANTENLALWLAESAARINPNIEGDEPVIYPPWQDRDFVSCQISTDFAPLNEAGIIEPEELRGVIDGS